MYKHLSTGLFAFLVLALLSACTPTAQPAVSTDDAAENAVTSGAESAESAQRGTLRIPHPLTMNGKDTLDPASPLNFEYAIIMLYDRLVSLGEGGQIIPALATAWEANEDATAWTFTLREGVTFHDGKPLTSADVAYTFRHILDPAVEAPAAATLNLIETIETPDEGTVVFQLGQPHADFPSLLVEYMARIIPDGSGDTIASTGIGTGPFKLESFNAEGTTVLVANDDYWNGAPQLAGIELIALADAEARGIALQADQVDIILNTTATQAALFEGNPDYTVLSFPTGQWGTLVMRTDTPPFDDVRVRKAMRLVADRQAMVDLVLDGQGTVACDNPVSTTDIYFLETECPPNIEQAKALLAEAGYADGLEVTLYTSDAESIYIPLAEVYQQQAAAAGINVNLEIVPADSYYTDVWGTEAFYPSYWRERPTDLILNLLWRSTTDWNESYYRNPAFDQLLDEARRELDFEQRRALYQQAQQMIMDEDGHLIPFFVNLTHIYSANVTGVEARSSREFRWETIAKSE